MKTSKVDLDADWLLRDKLKKLVDKNVTSEPYEGDTVDKNGIIDDIFSFFKEKHENFGTTTTYSILKHVK